MACDSNPRGRVGLVDTWSERRRRQHDRQMRLMDTATESTVTFLSAAERTTRACQQLDSATTSLQNVKGTADAGAYEHHRQLWEETVAALLPPTAWSGLRGRPPRPAPLDARGAREQP